MTSRLSSADDARQSILSAAVAIIHDHGAGALTVRSVAAGAGCSTTGVYTWFGGKNGLVEAIFLDGFERFGAALDRVRGAAEGQEQLVVLANAYRAWALRNPTHYAVMFANAVPDFSPSLDARVTARATFDCLVDATARVLAEHRIDATADDIAHHLWAGIHGYVSLELSGMDMRTTESERARAYRDGLRRLLRGCLT